MSGHASDTVVIEAIAALKPCIRGLPDEFSWRYDSVRLRDKNGASKRESGYG